MRIPKPSIARLLAGCLLTAFLAACGGSGGGPSVANGGGGGIVGTGKQVVASGEVSGFGSIIVNGIEFSRSSDPDVSPAPIVSAFDNSSSSREDSLRVGMVVAVSGSYDPVSGKGSYSRIVFSPELRGPLDNGSVNPAAGKMQVMGRTVQVGAATVFDGVADLDELGVRQGQGLELEVSGYLDSSGMLHASRIGLKSNNFSGGSVQR